MLADRATLKIVEALTGLGNALDMSVIAEGVENAEEGLKLSELGCGFAQGYLYSRPLAPDQVVEMLRNPGDALGGI